MKTPGSASHHHPVKRFFRALAGVIAGMFVKKNCCK
jgi:hypothetical protein